MKEMSLRTRKVAGVIQAELSSVIRKAVKDPQVLSVPMITISSVEVSPDHRNANVYVSFMGMEKNEKHRDDLVKVLNKAKKVIRHHLIRSVAFKVVPELNFKFDNSFDYAASMRDVLANV